MQCADRIEDLLQQKEDEIGNWNRRASERREIDTIQTDHETGGGHRRNYPFATIDPNVGVVAVPDERLEKLNELSKSKKKIPAVVEFFDIAGLVKGANKGEGLGNQFLSHIRETQAIVIVLRVFQNPEIIHVENSVNALRDLEIVNTELILKDLETVEKRLAKAEAEARSGKKEAQARQGAFGKIETVP